MDKEKILEKLIRKTNVSYDEGKNALEKSGWNILDAVLFLEEEGKVKKPKMSIYYSNENHDKGSKDEIIKVETKRKYKENFFESFIESVCSIIDRGNNILFNIKRNNRILLKLPLTVVILLLVFTFGVSAPLFIIGFFIDIQYSFEEKGVEIESINNILRKISKEIQSKKKNKKGRKYE